MHYAAGAIIVLKFRIKNQWNVTYPWKLSLVGTGQLRIALVFSKSAVIPLEDMTNPSRAHESAFFQINIKLSSLNSLHYLPWAFFMLLMWSTINKNIIKINYKFPNKRAQYLSHKLPEGAF